ncbi:NAD(P)-binding protein [Periconia macrospinosa]|uniref:NAD(P)-binding protein n=1 Tax=Periconia macrospinosa TaxID=97972 RepID=A0A2V1E1Q2_9PLEO|nr:NAD(P)-binding protein [Periconia macrospinosa]
MPPLPIALIGSGIFAREEHLPAILAASSSLSLVAIYSRSLASATALAEQAGVDPGVEVYSDDGGKDGKGGYEELLKKDGLKGVVIALPILTQPSYICKALEAGKHVLAEKPIAKDVATAVELTSWYRDNFANGPTFSIAENFRFLDSYLYASEQVASLGRVLGFRVRVHSFVQPGGKYFETAWRKKPEYQGGFLLDGGVHFVAGTRLVLGGAGVKPVKTSAWTTQLQEHLPPVDTVDATVRLSNGASGTISLSFGTTFSGSEYAFALEKGTVTVSRGKVTVKRNGEDEQVKNFPDEGSGVKQEIAAWGKALQEGKENKRQSPEEALGDLEWLEAMLQSGEKGGAPVELHHS